MKYVSIAYPCIRRKVGRHVPLKLLMCAFLVTSCGEPEDNNIVDSSSGGMSAIDSTGGNSSAGGSANSSGGAAVSSGGVSTATGGALSGTGGADSTGGSTASGSGPGSGGQNCLTPAGDLTSCEEYCRNWFCFNCNEFVEASNTYLSEDVCVNECADFPTVVDYCRLATLDFIAIFGTDYCERAAKDPVNGCNP